MSNTWDRGKRDQLANDARVLWSKPVHGQTSISLSESQLEAIFKLFQGYLYCDVIREPLSEMIDTLRVDMFSELGRQAARNKGVVR